MIKQIFYTLLAIPFCFLTSLMIIFIPGFIIALADYENQADNWFINVICFFTIILFIGSFGILYLGFILKIWFNIDISI